MNELQVIGTKLDYFIIIFYFFAIFGFGAIFARFTTSTKDFFLGGQRFSWWLIAFSYVASIVGSYSFIKYSAAGFRYGLSSSMSYLNDWIPLAIVLLAWVPIIYFSRSRSVPEYFLKRFNNKTRITSTIIIMFYMVGYIGINLYTMGVALNAMLGTDIFWSAVVVAIVCGIYVTAGGQTSVIMTDLIQGVILLVAGILLFVIGLNFIGGWDIFWGALPLSFKLPLAGFSKPHNFNFAGVFWQDGIANTMALYMVNQGFILRFLSLKSVKEARKTFIALILILMPLAVLAIGNAGWLGKAMVNLNMLPSNTNPDHVFVLVAEKLCRPGIFGFVMAALTAALMSTVDTLINAVSSISINDIYKPYINKTADDKHYLKAARVVSLAAAGVGILLVPLFASFKSIYVAHGSFTAAVTPPLVAVILLGVFWKRFTPTAAFCTLVGGSIAIILSIIWPELVRPFSHGVDPSGGFKYMRALYGLVTSGLIGITVSLFTKPKPYNEIEGLVVGTINKARERFKGGPVNDEEGKKALAFLKIADGTNVFKISPQVANTLKANVGDLIYLADARSWLGGLRSIHAKISDIHQHSNDSIYISSDLIAEGELLAKRKHRIEKIF